MNVNGSEYYYRKNLQGDVIAVYDDNGHMECRYDYDAWGRHRCRLENGTVIYDSATGAVSGYEEHIGIRNAIRYRSYYWDSETGLYYLQSRYYDPEVGRFISPDDIEYLEPESIGGLNLYAYCANDPVMNIDPSGHFAISTFLISLAIGSLISWGLSEIFGAQNCWWYRFSCRWWYSHFHWHKSYGIWAMGYSRGSSIDSSRCRNCSIWNKRNYCRCDRYKLLDGNE